MKQLSLARLLPIPRQRNMATRNKESRDIQLDGTISHLISRDMLSEKFEFELLKKQFNIAGQHFVIV